MSNEITVEYILEALDITEEDYFDLSDLELLQMIDESTLIETPSKEVIGKLLAQRAVPRRAFHDEKYRAHQTAWQKTKAEKERETAKGPRKGESKEAHAARIAELGKQEAHHKARQQHHETMRNAKDSTIAIAGRRLNDKPVTDFQGSDWEKDSPKDVARKAGKKERPKAVAEPYEEEYVHEETAAASSLHPGARAIENPKSKLEVMNHVTNTMSGMGKDDLLKWFNDTMSQFGPGKTYGVGDNSAKNASTIDMSNGIGPKTKMPMPKLGVKEDVEEMFAGEDLTEEFKEKATTLFEAAVGARINLEVARLEEEYDNYLNEAIENITEEVTSKVDTYLDYVVENWMNENKVAVESTLRNELVTDFIDGMKGLFTEHYINIPEDKVDVLETMAEKVEELESRQDALISENVELKKALVEVEKDNVLDSMMEGLALSQQEKFAALSEGIDFDGDLSTYKKKLSVIKENYFGTEKKSFTSSNIEEETFEGNSLTESVHIDPSVNKYVQAISRSIKK